MTFELPSILNLIISTIAFSIAAWYCNRYLDGHGIGKGTTRGVLVFAVASLVSWGAGEAADLAQKKIDGPQPASQTSKDLSQLLKAEDQSQP